jgi:hypothetical protein
MGGAASTGGAAGVSGAGGGVGGTGAGGSAVGGTGGPGDAQVVAYCGKLWGITCDLAFKCFSATERSSDSFVLTFGSSMRLRDGISWAGRSGILPKSLVTGRGKLVVSYWLAFQKQRLRRPSRLRGGEGGCR